MLRTLTSNLSAKRERGLSLIIFSAEYETIEANLKGGTREWDILKTN